MGKDEDQFHQVTGSRNVAKAMVSCKKCDDGRCPLRVVGASNLPGKVPAICLGCGATYTLNKAEKQLWQAAAKEAKGKNKTTAPKQSGPENKKFQDLQKRLAAAEAENKKLKGRADAPVEGLQPGEGEEEEHGKANALAAELRELQRIPEAARQRWSEYAAVVAAVQQDLEKARASARDARPLESQRAAVEGRCKTLTKQHEGAEAKLKKLQDEQAALAARIAEQQLEASELAEKLAAAKQERVAIAEKLAASHKAAVGEENQAAPHTTSFVTAKAVSRYFESLPAEITDTIEGKEKMQLVTQWLNEIDSAAIRITAAQEVETAGASEGVYLAMDEDTLTNQLAEAAVPPAGPEEGASESRAKSVLEARANIKKQNLLAGRAVKRTITK